MQIRKIGIVQLNGILPALVLTGKFECTDRHIGSGRNLVEGGGIVTVNTAQFEQKTCEIFV